VSVNPKISLQLYTVREQMASDFEGTVKAVADIGLRHVEPFEFATDTARLARAMEANGLDAPSGHEGLLGKDQDEIFRAANLLGIATVVDNFLNPDGWSTDDDIRRLAEDLNAAAQKGKEYGVRVGIHNHHWEVQYKASNGLTGLELLASHLDPEVVLEVDAYWAAAGGENVPELLSRLGDRVRLLHLKDGPIQTNFKDQVPVGKGKLPWKEILASATSLEVGIIELDEFDGDMLEAVRASFDYLTALAREG
jgi:sugar phosphate isomerase/epimerase